MIWPLLEGVDPARRPLLFCVEFWPVARCLRRGGLNCPNLASGLRWDQQFAPLIAENSSVSWPLQRLRGYPRVVYLDAASTKPFWGVRGASRNCGAVRRDSAFRHGRKLDGAPSPEPCPS